MRSSLFLLALLGCVVGSFGAERDLKTSTGQAFKAEIKLVEPDGLTVSHETGITKIHFSHLSKEIQTEFGYDPAKAEAYALASSRARAAAQRARLEEAAKELKTARRATPSPTPRATPGSTAGRPAATPRLLIDVGEGGKANRGLGMKGKAN